MFKKNYLYFGLVLVAMVAVAFAIVNRGDRPNDSDSIIPTPTPTAEMTENATSTPKPFTTNKPVPTLDIKVVENFESLARKLDLDGNRRIIILNDECSELLPSQVAYKNNTEIMLDNTRSSKPHILKIGGLEYSLEAGAWIMTTLSSSVVPAALPIFCGSMELGSIDLL